MLVGPDRSGRMQNSYEDRKRAEAAGFTLGSEVDVLEVRSADGATTRFAFRATGELA